jgi:Tfp pilus assembly protein PilP
MKLTTSILTVAMMAGAGWAQNTDAIDNARSVAKSLQQKQAIESNDALDAAGVPAKPAPGQAAAKPAGQQTAGQKPAPATVAPAKTPVKPVPASHVAAPAAKPQMKAAATGKTAAVTIATQTPKPASPMAAKGAMVAKGSMPAKGKKVKIAAAPEAKPAVAVKVPAVAGKIEAPKPPQQEEKKWAMNGKRDPFFSPIVQSAGGSGCSTGKKCLEIGHINVRGVVKSDAGFIAVVTNDLNKAYFLRENDPVFNGYVVRITGDSVVFQETVQDKLGKPSTREVTKRILTPAV